MEALLLKTHSVLRYLILVMLTWSLFTAWSGWKGQKSYKASFKKIHNVTRLLLILQMLLGIGLYYLFGFYKLWGHLQGIPEQAGFFTIGHVSMMLIAIACINIGYAVAVRAASDKWKFRRIAIFYSIGCLVIFMAIPWPFLHSWATWI